jgi:two-component system response regulator PilR (NtrC family)
MSAKPRVLLVDDEISIREMLEIFLKRHGFEVTSAGCGEEGVDAVREATFDVIVSDIRMPDMTGIDLLRRVRAEGVDTDVILLTAYATAETAIQALKVGAFDYILKTDNFMDELNHIVGRALEERRLRQENTYLKREFRKQHGLQSLIGRSDAMQTRRGWCWICNRSVSDAAGCPTADWRDARRSLARKRRDSAAE